MTLWDSPDVWVRNLSPAVEGAGALPATYGTPGSTQSVLLAQANYVYVRVKNIGPAATSTFHVRVYLTHFAGRRRRTGRARCRPGSPGSARRRSP